MREGSKTKRGKNGRKMLREEKRKEKEDDGRKVKGKGRERLEMHVILIQII